MKNQIYKITCLINKKVYIGQTKNDYEYRWKEHCKDYLRPSEEKRPLYLAMAKYGIENFIIELIEDDIPDELIDLKEIYCIKHFNSYVGFKDSNGYNATLGGDGKRYNEKLIGTTDNIIFEYVNNNKNCADIAKIYDCDRKTILNILKANNVKIRPLSETMIKVVGKPKKYQVDINTKKILNIFNSQPEANLSLNKKTSNHTISDALNTRRGHHRAFGYEWYYETDYKK